MSALFKMPARISRLTTLDQVAWLKDYRKAIEDSIEAAKDRAVKEGLAEYVTTERETSPNKATFIAEFGEKIWSRMCKRTEVTTWRAKP
jgi:hypothetical protein